MTEPTVIPSIAELPKVPLSGEVQSLADDATAEIARFDGGRGALIAMQETLLGESNPQFVGKWRTQQVWIGGSNYGPHRAMFVPPHHERVPADIDDLISFLGRDDIPALIHAAVAHAQFETIHPFPDGNGRTGRALIGALLRARGCHQRNHPDLGRVADRHRRLLRRTHAVSGGRPRADREVAGRRIVRSDPQRRPAG